MVVSSNALATESSRVENYKYLSGCRSVIAVDFMHIKARSLFGLYRFCLHVALRKRYFGSCNGMMRHCREIVKLVYEYLLWIEANVDVRRSIM